jgi:hypothetical protein
MDFHVHSFGRMQQKSARISTVHMQSLLFKVRRTVLTVRPQLFLGLVACHSFCLYFILYNIHTYIHSNSYNTSPFAEASLHFLIACMLSGKHLPGVPSRESNSGLPYSKPTSYQLSHAAPLTSLCYLVCSSHLKR